MPLHTIKKLTLAAITAALAALSAQALVTVNYFTRTSAMAEDRWIKIKVSQTGIQQITGEQLRALGFEHPEHVAVCGYGSSMINNQQISSDVPDDLTPVAAIWDGEKLMFYGEADFSASARLVTSNRAWSAVNSRNYYTAHGCYFLTTRYSPVRPRTVKLADRTPANWLDTSASQVHIEQENIMPEVGARFFHSDFVAEPKQTFDVFMPGYRQSTSDDTRNYSGRTGLNITLAAGVGSERSGTGRWYFEGENSSTYKYINHFTARPNEVVYREAIQQEHVYLANPAKTADDHYTLRADISTVTGVWFYALDYLSIIYRRDNDLSAGGQQRLIFENVTNRDNMRFTGLTEGSQVWDITKPRSPRILTLSEPGYDSSRYVTYDTAADATKETPATIIVFDPATDPYPVEIIGEVPCQNLHGMSVPQMLIIAASTYLPQAERLAQLHRDLQGLDVAVVPQDLIYNEYSSGMSHPMGIRRFIKMLALREPGRLRSLLLFGAAAQDNRNIRGLLNDHQGSYIPIFQNQQITSGGWLGKSYATDAIYGVLSEDFTLNGVDGRNLLGDMEINVGRIPAYDSGQATAIVDKIEEYLKNPPVAGSFNRALLCADAGNRNDFLQQADETEATIRENFPSVTIAKAYNPYFPGDNLTATIERNLSSGVGYWYYTGHASPGNLSGANWGTGQIKSNTYTYPPFAMLATCRAAYYDHEDGFGTTALFQPAGGVIGLVAAIREVYKDPNHVLGTAVTEKYFTADETTTTGDVFRLARNQVNRDALAILDGGRRDSSNIINTACYNFLGDPEIPLYIPAEKVRLTSVNGSTDGKATVSPLQKFTISGEAGPQGSADETFDGELTIAIYDAPFQATATTTENGETFTHTSTLDQDVIFECRVPVVRGRFTADITLPTPARPGVSNRVTLYAATPDGTRRAVGSYEGLTVTDLPEGFDESLYSAPEITAAYLNDPSFTSGDNICGTPTLFATFAPDDTGLAGNSSLLGQSLTVTLDDSKTYYKAAGLLKYATDGSASLEFPLGEIADGPHTVTVKVRNMAGISASRTLDFTLVNTPVKATLTAETDSDNGTSTINLTHSLEGTPEATLQFFDAAGNNLYTATGATFPFTMPLRDNSGAELPQGRYTVRALLHYGLQYGATDPVEIIVLK